MGRKTGSQRREDQQNRREDQQKKRTAKVIEKRQKAIWSRSGVPKDQTNRTWRVDDDENRELLVVGKLGQPICMSDETDTTFVLRWDT